MRFDWLYSFYCSAMSNVSQDYWNFRLIARSPDTWCPGSSFCCPLTATCVSTGCSIVTPQCAVYSWFYHGVRLRVGRLTNFVRGQGSVVRQQRLVILLDVLCLP